MGDSLQVKCSYCDRTTTWSREAIVAEITRLKTYNYEILTCIHCSRKFSRYDFEKALGTFKYEDIVKIMDENVNNSIPKPSTLYHESEEDLLERLKKVEEEKLKQDKILQDEIKKMQAGEPYDEKIVGPVEMEEGTPKDRNCVRVLKKEAELYAYTFLFIDQIVTGMYTILLTIWKAFADLIHEIIKRINWCIACSTVRIGYFIGFIGLIIGSILSLAIRQIPITPSPFSPSQGLAGDIAWTVVIITIAAIPLAAQLSWAFATPKSRWAKVIKKRADELIK
jgi:hypothetical protein